MKITSDTKISALINHDKRVIDVIVSVNKNFRKLKNPVLRKLLAPRVSIADAAKIGGVKCGLLLTELSELNFDIEELSTNKIEIKKNINMERKNITELDVRPILAEGVDPFKKIMETLKEMGDDGTLKIINTFEPIPLLNILKVKGYIYESERPEKSLVYTYLQKSGEVAPKEVKKDVTIEDFETIEGRFAGKFLLVDVRELEMPMPMVNILEELEKLEDDQALFVQHKRLPQYLMPELENRHFKLVSKEIDEDNINLIIYK